MRPRYRAKCATERSAGLGEVHSILYTHAHTTTAGEAVRALSCMCPRCRGAALAPPEDRLHLLVRKEVSKLAALVRLWGISIEKISMQRPIPMRIGLIREM